MYKEFLTQYVASVWNITNIIPFTRLRLEFINTIEPDLYRRYIRENLLRENIESETPGIAVKNRVNFLERCPRVFGIKNFVIGESELLLELCKEFTAIK